VTQEPDPEDIRARLSDLVDYPQETLAVEIKSWLNLSDETHKASVAQALIALSNHGGGNMLIGFQEEGGEWKPASPHPESLSGFNQDLINGIVQRYAEPTFHCEMHFPRRSDSGLQYPVVSVPPSRVPIRSKRDGPNGQHISNNTYYIRRPGPCSEAPRTGEEWDRLLRRCVLTTREDILDDFRLIMGGTAPNVTQNQAEGDNLRVWTSHSVDRWRELVDQRFGDASTSPYVHGWWSASYVVEPSPGDIVLADLLSVLSDVPGYTGWRPWWVPTRQDIVPYPYDGAIECWLATKGQDAGHADFWRATVPLRLFLLRGYQEDSEIEDLKAGTAFDLILPIWRTAEVMLHASKLSELLGSARSPAKFEFTWTGLRGRRLVSVGNRRRDIYDEHICRQEQVTSGVAEVASDIPSHLPELVRKVTSDLYSAFGFFQPPDNIYAEELRRMTTRSVSFEAE
jgi:hypothetical protein